MFNKKLRPTRIQGDTMKRIITLLILVALAFPKLSVAKDKTIKIGKTVIYTGEVADKKTPSGAGVIVFNNQAKKATEADTIRGLFSTRGEVYEVSDAVASFANGAIFFGEATIRIETLSDKPVVEKITCVLDGHLEWPGNPVVTGTFTMNRTTNCGDNTSELALNTINPKEVWTMIHHHGAYQGELKNGTIPKGRGTLYVVADKHFELDKVIDVVEGVFDGNTVTDAKMTFNSGYGFIGDLEYEVLEKGDDEIFKYNLNGVLKDSKGNTMFCDSAFVIKRHTDYIHARTSIDDFNGTSNIRYLDKEYVHLTGCDTLEVSRRLKLSEKPFGTWNREFGFAEEEPVYYYTNGTQVKVLKDGINVDRGDFNYQVKDGHLMEFFKVYKEGIFHYVKAGQSEIIYNDGSKYRGTLSISTDHECKSIEDEVKAYIEVPRMNDYRIMYLEGTTTLANGKTDIWKEGITDYQSNKIAGNYERIETVVAASLREEAKEATKAWDAARPLLEQEFGKYYVDVFYGYRLEVGMPLELFKRAQQMGLPYYELLGPFSTNKGPFNSYVISIKNRETGELQYQRSIKFDRFNHLKAMSTQLL